MVALKSKKSPFIIGVLCICCAFFAAGCKDTIDKLFEGASSGSEKSDSAKTDTEPVAEENGADGTPQLHLAERSPENLGSVLFLGNSHTHNAGTLTTLAVQNNYALTVYYISTGGNIPLGNDKFTHDNPYITDMDCTLEESEAENHLGNFISQLNNKILKNSGEKLALPFSFEDLSWVFVHDGSVPNSLTSAGSFMGLATAFGAKTACYQSWDLVLRSAYAAHSFKMPMIPVGWAIPVEGKPYHYHDDTGHMSSEGLYVFAVSFLHFLTGKDIDSIEGDAGLGLTPVQIAAAKERAKAGLEVQQSYGGCLETAGPFYYENLPELQNPGKAMYAKNIAAGKKTACTLAMGQPGVYRLPASTAGKKLQVTLKSGSEQMAGDLWFYNTVARKLVAQGYSEYANEYRYTGTGEPWETDGSCVMIVTRRGLTKDSGCIKPDQPKEASFVQEWGPIAQIVENIETSVEFTVTVNFD